MPTVTLPYDPAEDLTDVNDQEALLEEAFSSGDGRFIAAALGAVARARGMSGIAMQTGMSRPTLYRSLSEDGDPQLSTLLRVVAALGFRVALVPDRAAPAPGEENRTADASS